MIVARGCRDSGETRADFVRQLEIAGRGCRRRKSAGGCIRVAWDIPDEYRENDRRCHAVGINAHVRGLHLTGSKNQWPRRRSPWSREIGTSPPRARRRARTSDARTSTLRPSTRFASRESSASRRIVETASRARRRAPRGRMHAGPRGPGEGKVRERGERRRENGRHGEGAARMAALV